MIEMGKSKDAEKKFGYLIPEFCMMTGVPDDFNEF